MRIFWLNDGIHIKAESHAEHDSLVYILKFLKSVRVGHEVMGGEGGAIQGCDEQSAAVSRQEFE